MTKPEPAKIEIHKPTLDLIIKEVSGFGSVVICEGRDETPEEKLINQYVEGTVQGYNDAVKQIVEFLENLRTE